MFLLVKVPTSSQSGMPMRFQPSHFAGILLWIPTLVSFSFYHIIWDPSGNGGLLLFGKTFCFSSSGFSAYIYVCIQ